MYCFFEKILLDLVFFMWGVGISDISLFFKGLLLWVVDVTCHIGHRTSDLIHSPIGLAKVHPKAGKVLAKLPVKLAQLECV